jgi:type I restriction enzyme S subunit
MGSEWVTCRLGDVFVCNAETYSPAEKWDYVNYLDTGNITNGTIASIERITDHKSLPSRARRKVRAGDIVYSTVRPNQRHYGIIAEPLPNMLVSTGFAVLRGREGKADTKFVYYFLTQPQVVEYLHSIAENSTSAYPSIKPGDIESLKIKLPPLPVQRRIAAILGALDDKIELNRRMSRTLEAMARALFKSWFVDFDPVRAKMEGRWRRGQSLPLPAPQSRQAGGLPAHLWDLFPDRLVDSELGEIPEGWDVATLADFAALNPESWSKDTRPEVIKYVDLSNTKWGRIEAVTTHTRHDAPSRAQRVLRPGDTLVGTVRPGNGSYALVAEEGLTGSTGFAVLRPQKAEWAEFVYLAATAASNIDTLAHLADGAAYPAVRPEVVASTPVVRPDDSVLGEFSKYAAPLLARMAQSERESRTLAALRDALLPKLLSGKIDVPACAADVAAGRSALEGAADPPAQAGEVA